MALTVLDTLANIEQQVTESNARAASNDANISSVASSITSVQLLPANALRKGVVLFNDSTRVARIAFSDTASATIFTVKMPAGSLYESGPLVYTGEITVIWESVNGSMRVTELV